MVLYASFISMILFKERAFKKNNPLMIKYKNIIFHRNGSLC